LFQEAHFQRTQSPHHFALTTRVRMVPHVTRLLSLAKTLVRFQLTLRTALIELVLHQEVLKLLRLLNKRSRRKRVKKRKRLRRKKRPRKLNWLKLLILKEDHQRIQSLHQSALIKRVRMVHHAIRLSHLAKNLEKSHHLTDAHQEVLNHQERQRLLRSQRKSPLKSPRRMKAKRRKRKKRKRKPKPWLKALRFQEAHQKTQSLHQFALTKSLRMDHLAIRLLSLAKRSERCHQA